jgi:hypothetical protein
MTNLEALKASVAGYPLPDNTFLKVLLDRGVAATDAYAAKNKAFELATADVYTILSTAANISEGGFSVSISGKERFAKLASSIYSKYGVSGYSPTVTDASDRW